MSIRSKLLATAVVGAALLVEALFLPTGLALFDLAGLIFFVPAFVRDCRYFADLRHACEMFPHPQSEWSKRRAAYLAEGRR